VCCIHKGDGSRRPLSLQVLEQLTSQVPVYGKARYTVRTFAIRRNEKISVSVTVRGEKAYDLVVGEMGHIDTHQRGAHIGMQGLTRLNPSSLQKRGLAVKEFELIRKNFSQTGNFGERAPHGDWAVPCSPASSDQLLPREIIPACLFKGSRRAWGTQHVPHVFVRIVAQASALPSTSTWASSTTPQRAFTVSVRSVDPDMSVSVLQCCLPPFAVHRTSSSTTSHSGDGSTSWPWSQQQRCLDVLWERHAATWRTGSGNGRLPARRRQWRLDRRGLQALRAGASSCAGTLALAGLASYSRCEDTAAGHASTAAAGAAFNVRPRAMSHKPWRQPRRGLGRGLAGLLKQQQHCSFRSASNNIDVAALAQLDRHQPLCFSSSRTAVRQYIP
jgi:hypothetical protein